MQLSTRAAAHFTRGELATALRQNPYSCNILLAGVDPTGVEVVEGEKREIGGPSLYWMDYLASLNKLNYGAHGYISYFLLSLLDKNYKVGMSQREGLELVNICLDQLKRRFIINMPKFVVKILKMDHTVEVFHTAADGHVPVTD